MTPIIWIKRNNKKLLKMAILIVQNDFKLIGQLAVHCDTEKLEIAIQEAINFDFAPLVCDMFNDIDENWDSTDVDWMDLINGSKYMGCGSKTVSHLGAKKMLLYYIYARYVVLNNFNDTPNGHVNKTNDFSIPKPLKELESFSDKYRTMGYAIWNGVKKFVCHNKDNYTFAINDCDACDCDGGCSGTIAKGYGIKGKNISKWDA